MEILLNFRYACSSSFFMVVSLFLKYAVQYLSLLLSFQNIYNSLCYFYCIRFFIVSSKRNADSAMSIFFWNPDRLYHMRYLGIN